MQYWSEKYNQIPTFVLGQQSKVYPTAPVGFGVPDRCGSAEYAGASEKQVCSADWLGVFAEHEGRDLGQDHRRARENQYSRRLTGFSIR